MSGDNNNLILIVAIVGILIFLYYINNNNQENLDISQQDANAPIKTNLAPPPSLLVQQVAPVKVAVPINNFAKIPQVDKQIKILDTSFNFQFDISSNNLFKPIDDKDDHFPGLIGNYNLGIDINDPINQKFLAQAPKDKPKLNSADLLPGKPTEKWFETPDVGIKVEDAYLLSDATQKVGIDTVGQTRKNPSYDIRGTVPCPKFVVSPWNNSTYEPDMNLKSLC